MWVTFLERPNCSRYELHQWVWDLFPSVQVSRGERAFCYRDTGADLIVLSHIEPAAPSKNISVPAGTHLFELVSSTNRGTYRDESGKRRRLPDRSTHKQHLDWLNARLAGAGEVIAMLSKPMAPHKVIRKNGRPMVWGQVTLLGKVKVTQPDSFAEIISQGLGQGAAFGLGAMIIPELYK